MDNGDSMVTFHIFSIAGQRKAVLFLVQLLFAMTAFAQNQEVEGCGQLGNNYEGYAMDYYQATPFNRKRVEDPHFTREHAAIARGQTTVDYNNGAKGIPVSGSLDYTLRVWPNHPGALADMATYARIKKSEYPDGMKKPISCYFRMAIAFKPEDGFVRFLYTIHLLDFGHTKEAEEQFDLAVKYLENPNLNIRYNFGLIYFRLKRYDDARRIAEEVYGKNYELPGLRNLLKKAGKW